MPPRELETLVSDVLAHSGVAILVDAVEGDVGRDEVPDQVWRHSELIGSARRRADFVRGRLVRDRVGRRAGHSHRSSLAPCLAGADTSLTHAGGWAFAAAVADPCCGIGIGIDFEPAGRRIPADAARFFLSSRELDQVGVDSGGDADRLRLWTVKEACFKADPTNGCRTMREYQVGCVTALQGRVGHPSAFDIHYASCLSSLGPITVALSGRLRPLQAPLPSPGTSAVDATYWQEATQ